MSRNEFIFGIDQKIERCKYDEGITRISNYKLTIHIFY